MIFDIQRLYDSGLTILNGRSDCVPAPGSFDGDMVSVKPLQIILNSGPVGNWGRSENMKYCTFELDALTGEIQPYMENKPTNPWAEIAKNGRTYAENTKDFLKDYVISSQKSQKGGKKKNKTLKARKARKARRTQQTQKH